MGQTSIGTRVRTNAKHPRVRQGKAPRDGVVTGASKYAHCVRVKWDGIVVPETVSEEFLEIINVTKKVN